MSIADSYEINVAKINRTTGRAEHYCKIQLSETLEQEAKKKFEEVKTPLSRLDSSLMRLMLKQNQRAINRNGSVS